ncbi:MAG: hypothetical protein B6244_07360 [Candidatus Cloacimonetes bacterium 4572_55]|nr:MAG: hypothetical protein B6244_07360 [Candidatus Cloacimonetes bacterium 4572_55]
MNGRLIRLFVLLLAAGVTLAVNCQKKESVDKITTYGRYWSGIHEFMKVIALPEFKKNTGYDVDMVIYNNTIETLDRVEMETTNDDLTADFIWIDFMDILTYRKRDLLMDISDIVSPFANQIPDRMLDPCRDDEGRIFAAPHIVSIDLMMYNERHITPDELPNSYEELLEWCKKNPDRYSYRGSGEHLTTSMMNFFYAFGALEVGQDLSQFFNPDVNPKIVDVFEYLIELNKYTKKPLYTDYGTMDLEMANELLWLYSLWDDHVAKIRHNKNAPYVRLHPNYNLTGPTGKKAICLGGWMFAIPKNAANPKVGKKFISWMMSQEMQIRSVGDSSRVYCGHIPARIDATENLPNYIKNRFDVTDVASLRDNAFQSLVIRPTWVDYYFDLSTFIERAHNEIVVQGKPVGTVLKNVQTELDMFVAASSY